jgi:hypothetical protein
MYIKMSRTRSYGTATTSVAAKIRCFPEEQNSFFLERILQALKRIAG